LNDLNSAGETQAKQTEAIVKIVLVLNALIR